jgi:hypothetical protein
MMSFHFNTELQFSSKPETPPLPFINQLEVTLRSTKTNKHYPRKNCKQKDSAAKHRPLLASTEPTSSLSESWKRPWLKSYSLGTLTRRGPNQ